VLIGAHPLLTLCPQNDSVEQSEDWLQHWAAAGMEGVL
jgi:hypothetical protein